MKMAPPDAARFSLGWLVAANLVGFWMALLLVWPELGEIFGDCSYGRWAPLHMNWQLYGWCSLPLVGLLLKRFGVGPGLGRAAYGGWSAALLVGGATWLAGSTSGKLFLDWNGLARWVLVGMMGVLWCVLANAWWRTRARPGIPFAGKAGALVVLAVLAFVPALLWWSSGRSVYPAINPTSGGPTGASLLGSTLGVVLILGIMPRLLGRCGLNGESSRAFWWYFAFCVLAYAALDHHCASNRDLRQVAGLGALLGWIPLLLWYLGDFHWAPGTRPWLGATLFWFGALVVTAVLAFCPFLLDRIKFTHGLVVHSHLAMAGFLTSLNMVLLANLSPPTTRAALARRGPFWLWHGSLLGHLASLAGLAACEVAAPALLFQHQPSCIALSWLRLISGSGMAWASIWWFLGAWAESGNTEPASLCAN